MMLRHSLALTTVLTCALACAEPVPDLEPVPLGPAEWSIEVTGAPEVAVLEDGRIALAMPGDHFVVVLRADGTIADSVGRDGEAPGEFRTLASVVALAGGGYAVVDPAMQRLTTFDRNDSVVAITPVLAPHQVFRLELARDGSLASQVGRDGIGDSALVMVSRAGAAGYDSTVRVHTPPREMIPLGQMAINVPPEYSTFDAWGQTDSGDVWVARGGDNRLELHAREGVRAGIAVPFVSIATVPEDRDRWRGLPAPEHIRTAARPLAPRKAPFQEVVRASDGTFWFWLNQPHGYSTELYSCRTLDSGELARVRVPGAHRIVAVHADRIFLYGEDAEGTPSLSAHRAPGPACSPA